VSIDLRSHHMSDCAVHNEPAMPAGPCDCGLTQILADRLRWHANNLHDDLMYAAIETDLRIVADHLEAPRKEEPSRPHRMKIVDGEIEVCDTCVNSGGNPVGWDQTWHAGLRDVIAGAIDSSPTDHIVTKQAAGELVSHIMATLKEGTK